MKKVSAIILDWAGTTVDYGCFAPVNAFISAFEEYGITPTIEETRAPMGMEKRAHIAKMLDSERLAALWNEKHGRPHTEKDVSKIYNKFEPALFKTLEDYTDLIPGVLETVNELRKMDIVIGSTTGYTSEMMDIVVPCARDKGYIPDYVVCPEDVGNGRPYPYMIWHNLKIFRVADVRNVVKVGDTTADIEEGKNAGCISVGVLKGSSMLGLSEKEYADTPFIEIEKLLADARSKYIEAGADYVLDDITELPELIVTLNANVQNCDCYQYLN